MKNYYKLALAALAAIFTATGCTSKFLEVENPTGEPIEEYFTTVEHLEEAIIAAYDPLEWTDWDGEQYSPLTIMSDIMADQLWVGGSDKTDNQHWHMLMNFEASGNYTITNIWKTAYSGVKRCNDVLTYIDWTTDFDEYNTPALYEAHARVLRVYYYSWLWKFWGNIPYYEENLENPYVAEQVDHDTVYENMMQDLEGAIALNQLTMDHDPANQGVVTKAMAYMLYAELAMYQNDASRLPQALTYMKEIISSGDYSLTENYGDIFKESGEWNDESIFEINYKDDNAVRSWSWSKGAGGTCLPRLISPNGWSGDTDHDNGWGFCPVRTETYEMFSENDTRRDATVWNAAADGSYNARYQDTGYFLEKYIAYSANCADQLADSDLNFNNNWRIYRYAETLLNAAELVVEGYGSGDAETWLNMVHQRAIPGETVALSLENIKEERRLEFVGEGKRYWDLVRWGDASSVLVPDDYGYRTNTWSSSKKYIPIPQSEIDATAGTSYPLTQNNY